MRGASRTSRLGSSEGLGRASVAAVGLALAFSAAAAAAEDAAETSLGAFDVEPAYFMERVHSIALMPVWVSGDLDEGDPELRNRLEARVAEELAKAGFAVVASRVYDAIWRDMAQRVGGIYDSRTGQRDADKFATVREHTLRELARLHAVDATLATTLFVDYEVAPRREVSGEGVSWHGRQLFPFWHPQATRIARLKTVIWDTADRTLYSVWTEVAWLRVYFNQGYEDRRLLDVPEGERKLDDALLGNLFYLTAGRWPYAYEPNASWARRAPKLQPGESAP